MQAQRASRNVSHPTWPRLDRAGVLDLLAAAPTPQALRELGADGIAEVMRACSPRLARTLPAQINWPALHERAEFRSAPSRGLRADPLLPGPRRIVSEPVVGGHPDEAAGVGAASTEDLLPNTGIGHRECPTQWVLPAAGGDPRAEGDIPDQPHSRQLA
jgi:hypothetical protein